MSYWQCGNFKEWNKTDIWNKPCYFELYCFFWSCHHPAPSTLQLPVVTEGETHRPRLRLIDESKLPSKWS